MSGDRSTVLLTNGRPSETVTGAVLLTAGLAVVTPVFTLLVRVTGIGLPYPALLCTGLVGLVYGVLALYRGVSLQWALAGLAVTGTFGANVPLTSTAGAYPGTLGPSLWLVHVPLLVTAGMVFARYGFSASPVTKVELGLTGLVVWSLVSTVTGRAVGVKTALYFAVFWAVNGLLVFVVVKTATSHRAVSGWSVVAAVCVAAVGHALWAVLQFLNSNSFALSTLGEGRQVWATPEVTLGPLGSVPIGAFVSGFTGGPLPFVCLLVLVTPSVLAWALVEDGRSRYLAFGVIPVLVAGIRTSDKLSGIGGFVLAASVFGILVMALIIWTDVDTPLRSHLTSETVAATLASLALVAYPSSYPSNRATVDEKSRSAAEVTGGSEGVVEQVQSVGDLTIDGPDPTGIPGWLPWVRADSTLGIRIQQYVAAVDLFGYAPFVGIGGGNFSWYAAVYGIPVPPGHPLPLALHNLYLSLLVETGLPGLLTFAAAAGTVLWYSGRSVVDAAAGRIFETTDGVLAAGALAGLLGFLSIAFWDTVQIQITAIVPFWVVAGALVGDRLGWTRGGATDGS
jgi:hypothetical protein